MNDISDSKELFDYWHKRVRLKNAPLISAPDHIPTQELRHECTNYDSLRVSNEVQILEEPERSQVIAVIKYQCTAQVLQRRSGLLREKANQLEDACYELERERSRLGRLIRQLQEKLFGKDSEIRRLENRILALEAENEALRSDSAKDGAYKELEKEFDKLQKKYESEVKRREELGRNNQRLGGRVSHAKRNKEKLERARVENKELRNKLDRSIEQKESLEEELARLRKQLKLGIIEVKPK
ncbi:hypothetical protein [Synechococcus sp. PCC 7336]|uniref:hypothetical protein n=1 Tax=Synechococcus sp. PCC 7336 TaxID=195250 RepID=UPI000379F090|nr:hypothetical protein [Synechococcus sp. PCC 7336]